LSLREIPISIKFSAHPEPENLVVSTREINRVSQGVMPKAFPDNKTNNKYYFRKPGEPQKRDARDFKKENSKPLRLIGNGIQTRSYAHFKLNESEGNSIPSDVIPSLMLAPPNPLKKSSHILLYFHANAEDINQTYPLLNYLRNKLKIWIIAIEYPGYGIYEGEPTESGVLDDAKSTINWLKSEVFGSTDKRPFNNLNKLIVCGRSLGSGVASYIADTYPVAALILISPFTSIKDMAKNMFGLIGSALIKQRFDNLERIKTIKCPTLIIHGKKDTVIPHVQGEELYSKFYLKNCLF
jgi:alpha-beta hydrolase superfamily lysophospholipase